MNKQLKQKWIEALRSGNYIQGQGALHIEGDYCCLGVLCMVDGADCDAIDDISDLDDPGLRDKKVEWGLDRLSCIVQDREPSVYLTIHDALVYLNDTAKWNFNQIAGWIETHVPSDLDSGFVSDGSGRDADGMEEAVEDCTACNGTGSKRTTIEGVVYSEGCNACNGTGKVQSPSATPPRAPPRSPSDQVGPYEFSYDKPSPLNIKLWLDTRYNATRDLRYIHAGNALCELIERQSNDRRTPPARSAEAGECATCGHSKGSHTSLGGRCWYASAEQPNYCDCKEFTPSREDGDSRRLAQHQTLEPAQRESLVTALVRYGHHDRLCPVEASYKPGRVCECGFSSALDAAMEGGKK